LCRARWVFEITMNHEETIKRIQELTNGWALEFGCEVIDNMDIVSRILEVIPKTRDRQEVRTEHGIEYVDDITILGKPITLAVTLSAILKYEGLPITYLEAEEGDVGTDWSDLMYHFRDMNWNLSKDNFNDQTDETKMFIGGLLK